MKESLLVLLLIFIAIGYQCAALSLPSGGDKVDGIQVRPVPLHADRPQPYCLAAASIVDLPSSSNFLATQVWPSARCAANAIEKYASPHWTLCEFGCGPGLPSLTAASIGCTVCATDLDTFALQLVNTAAAQQNLDVLTKKCDLIQEGNHILQHGRPSKDWIPSEFANELDLIVFSDVFENNAVAEGAARVSNYFLDQGVRVWTFAQSDRVQRDAYSKELKSLWGNNPDALSSTTFAFTESEHDPDQRLWLCDLDETKIKYG